MDFIAEIEQVKPLNQQEENDKRIMLDYINRYKDTVLLRKNEIAHITSSGLVINTALDKVLLVHHNIRRRWSWTGGHADGDADLLRVALKEAKEETGVLHIQPLSTQIASLDILPVRGHQKNGSYVSTHLHLSVGYILLGDEKDELHIKPNENTAVEWMSTSRITKENFADYDVYLYTKLINKAKQIQAGQ